MKSCSRTRNVCPDAIVLTEASCLSPLACDRPVLAPTPFWRMPEEEEEETNLPILQKRIHEHRAPHPLRRDVVARPLAVLEQVLGVLIPARLGVLARRPLPGCARVSRRKKHSNKSSDSQLPRCIRPALLADIDHGKLDEFLAGHALNLTRDGRVRHAQRESPARPSRTVAHNAPSIPGEGRGSARRGPIRSKERHFFCSS